MTARAATAGAALVLAVLLASGCSTRTQLVTVKVPVPVACDEPVPDRPAMPTEALAAGASAGTSTWTLDGHVKALQAEVDVREGYEIQLHTALVACTRPVAPAVPADLGH